MASTSSQPQSLTAQLAALSSHFSTVAPPALAASIASIVKNFSAATAIQPNTPFPAFTLPNAVGEPVSLASLLADGKPVLITFYRGSWCPYCNLALRSLSAHADAFAAKGVTLVAISPELSDGSLSLKEKAGLKFEVLSDGGNELARKLGLVWKLGDEVSEMMKGFGIDLEKSNGEGEGAWEVPVPANILVDGKGVVRKVWVNADYRERLEPEVMLGWVDEL
ncbi:thioredoxin-like protein [Bombardia bombarda]|uniref:thioredoxin-dependent peroxiredoxin n=1 Tax=Bombardia bombarda TaxID=252184 RepID=A0AA40C8C4_9PEZI|nr:thioredoxin-like protein [Bombardia bombarda]